MDVVMHRVADVVGRDVVTFMSEVKSEFRNL